MRLEEWYLPTADGACTLYAAEAGDGSPGPPVVVLHGGFGHDHEHLIGPLGFLAESRRVVFYDQRGSLRSPAATETISVAAHVADLHQLRHELGAEQITLVAHSMGTHLAMRYLAEHPDVVREMVLVAAMAPAEPPPARWAEAADPAEWGARVASRRRQVEEVIRREGLDRAELGARDATRRWRVEFAGANIFHVERWREMEGGQIHYNPTAGAAGNPTDSFDFTGALEAHPHQVTVLAGDADFVDPGGDWHQEWYGSMAGVNVRVVPEAGHNVWVDQPKMFRHVIGEALLPPRR